MDALFVEHHMELIMKRRLNVVRILNKWKTIELVQDNYFVCMIDTDVLLLLPVLSMNLLIIT